MASLLWAHAEIPECPQIRHPFQYGPTCSVVVCCSSCCLLLQEEEKDKRMDSDKRDELLLIHLNGFDFCEIVWW